ncbi:MAG: hypothetical protein HY645_06585 [Acidobacteria bacterium]|nr:hypothetical protein [Acidobacteriota bacterium]
MSERRSWRTATMRRGVLVLLLATSVSAFAFSPCLWDCLLASMPADNADNCHQGQPAPAYSTVEACLESAADIVLPTTTPLFSVEKLSASTLIAPVLSSGPSASFVGTPILSSPLSSSTILRI